MQRRIAAKPVTPAVRVPGRNRTAKDFTVNRAIRGTNASRGNRAIHATKVSHGRPDLVRKAGRAAKTTVRAVTIMAPEAGPSIPHRAEAVARVLTAGAACTRARAAVVGVARAASANGR